MPPCAAILLRIQFCLLSAPPPTSLPPSLVVLLSISVLFFSSGRDAAVVPEIVKPLIISCIHACPTYALLCCQISVTVPMFFNPLDDIVRRFSTLFCDGGSCVLPPLFFRTGAATGCRPCSALRLPRRSCRTTTAHSSRSCGRASCCGARQCGACIGKSCCTAAVVHRTAVMLMLMLMVLLLLSCLFTVTYLKHQARVRFHSVPQDR